MDYSIASLSSGRNTRDPSPTRSEASSILARLESQTSALGHIGIVTWQKKDLQRQLAQQKGLTAQEQQNVAKLRRLALRLAAQIAVKENQLRSHAEALSKSRGVDYITTRRKDGAIRELEKRLQDDLINANALLRTMGGSHSIARYDGAGFHVASRPLSPPLSPFEGRRSLMRRGTSQSKARQLPSEILQLCQMRADTLLRESDEHQQTIHTLEQNQTLLRKSVAQKDTEIAKLRASRTKIQEALDTSEKRLCSMRSDLANSEKAVNDLTEQKSQLIERLASLQAQLDSVHRSLESSESARASTEGELDSLRSQINDVSSELTVTKNRIAELETLNHDLEAERAGLALDVKKSSHRNLELVARIAALEEEALTSRTDISSLQECRRGLEQKQGELEQKLVDANSTTSHLESKLSEANANFAAIKKSLDITLPDLDAEKARYKELTAEKQSMCEILEDFKRQNKRTEQLLAEKERALHTKQEQIVGLEKLRAELEEGASLSSSRLSAFAAQETEFRSHVAKLESSIIEQEGTINSLKYQLSNAQSKEEQSIRALDDADSQFAAVSEQLQRAETNSTETSKALKAAEQSRNALKGELEQVHILHTEALQRLQAAKDQHESEKGNGDNLQRLLLETQNEFESSRSALSKLQLAHSDLQGELNRALEEQAASRETLIMETKSKEVLKKQLHVAEGALCTQKEELISLNNLKHDATLELEQLQASLANALDSSTTYQLSSDSAEEKAKSLEGQILALGQKITDFQDRERDASEAARSNRSIISKLEEQLAQTERDKSRMHCKLDELSATISTLQQSKNHLEEKLQAASRESQEVRDINRTLQDEVVKAQKAYADLQHANRNLFEKLQVSESAYGKLTAENARQVKELQHDVQVSQEKRDVLENQLSISESAALKLHKEIKSLKASNSDAQAKLRRSQAIRKSHENALGALRVRLGASKMAKRGVQVKLDQAEHEFEALCEQREKLEDLFAEALSKVTTGQQERVEQQQNIQELQDQYNRLEGRVVDSEASARNLRETIAAYELECTDLKRESSRRQAHIDRAETDIKSLKSQIDQMTEQQAKDTRQIHAKQQQIYELQNAMAASEKDLKNKIALVDSQKAEIATLRSECASSKNLIAMHESDIVNMRQVTASLKAKVDAKDNTIQKHQQRIETLERNFADADERAKALDTQLNDQTKLTHRLRVNNDKYEKDVPALREEIKNLEASRAALEERLRQFEIASRSSQITQESSPTLVTDEAELSSDRDTFDQPSRPMSPTRVNTGHSSMKAFRVLGAEAAAGQPGIEEDDVKKELWDLWASQHKLGPVHEETVADREGHAEISSPEPQRLRRKLTKKKRIDQLKTDDKGKVHHLIRFPSISRSALDGAPKNLRSLFHKN